MIADNLKSVRQRMTRCCEKSGRSSEEIGLICVTKETDIPQIEKVLDLGVKDLGENRVQELVSKYKIIGDRAAWHLVGHLQTNKVRDAVKIAVLIHSVDSIRLAKEIDKEAGRINKVQDILVHVNTSGEESKFGIAPEDAIDFVTEVSLYPDIVITGLMTIAPEVDDPEKARPYFRKLCELRDEINSVRSTQYAVRILSMGMSNDFEAAIEEGSNMVRIGRAIFGGH